MTRGLGWIRDDEDGRDQHLGEFDYGSLRLQPGASPGVGVPWSANCSGLLPYVFDQRSDQSCVAQAVAALVWAAHRRVGVEAHRVEVMSRKALWWLCRFERSLQDHNVGTQMRTAFQVLNRLGFCRERWHDHQQRYDVRPGGEAARMTHDQRTRGDGRVEYRSVTGGPVALKQAIAAGLPVVGGWQVGESFVRGGFDEREPVGPPVESVGGHAMVLHAYEGDDFLARSSWGEDWADDGSAWLRADYVAAGRDFWTVVRAPMFSDGASS